MDEQNKTNFTKEIKQSKELPRFRYQLGLPEQKMLLCFFGQLKQNADSFEPAEIPIGDVIAYCGFEAANGYRLVHNCAKALSKDILEYYNGKEYTFVPWFAYIKYKNGLIRYQLNPAIKTELLQLHEQGKLYVKVDPLLLPNFKSNYGLRMYLILKGEVYERKPEADVSFSLEEMVYMLSLSAAYDPKLNNNASANQKNKIIEPSKEEINKFTDITIEFEPIKQSRKVIGWHFHIETKENFNIPPKPLQQPAQQEIPWYKDADVISEENKLIKNGLHRASLTELRKYQSNKEDFITAAEIALTNLPAARQHKTIDNPGGFLYETIKNYDPEETKLIKESEAEEEYKKVMIIEKKKKATSWEDIIGLSNKQSTPKYFAFVLRKGAEIKKDLLADYKEKYEKEAREADWRSNEKYDIEVEIATYNLIMKEKN